MEGNTSDEQAKRRLAMIHKDLYEDANRMMGCALALLRGTDFDSTEMVEVMEKLRKKEVDATHRAHGRIEPRERFKAVSPNVALENRESMYLYLDESGTSTPFNEKSPPGHAIFALGGVAMTEKAKKKWDRGADAIKMEFWGHKNVTFHEPFMRKRSNEFNFNLDVAKQDRFLASLRKLLEEVPFTTFGAVIRKGAYKQEFLDSGRDPFLPTDAYALAISMILERFVDYLTYLPKRYRGRLLFESQGPKQDAEHQWSYASVMLNGTRYVPASAFMSSLYAGCEFLPKSGSHPVEIADIVSRDLHEWVSSDCKLAPLYWDIFSKKVFCRERGVEGTFGIKVFPASGLIDEIYDHRAACGAKLPAERGKGRS